MGKSLTSAKTGDRFRFAMKRIHAGTAVLLAACASSVFAQCPVNDATPPATPLTYPKTSDRYAVQYRIGSGAWTNAQVYISDYGATDGSPYRQDSGYSLETSMSVSYTHLTLPTKA